jgi:hypothetical protein
MAEVLKVTGSPFANRLLGTWFLTPQMRLIAPHKPNFSAAPFPTKVTCSIYTRSDIFADQFFPDVRLTRRRPSMASASFFSSRPQWLPPGHFRSAFLEDGDSSGLVVAVAELSLCFATLLLVGEIADGRSAGPGGGDGGCAHRAKAVLRCCGTERKEKVGEVALHSSQSDESRTRTRT